MFEGLLGSVIGGIGSLVGGIMGSNSARESNAQQLQIAQMNMEMQREFAQNGIRWKAYDAQQAGIHPAFAMGASTNSFSPVAYNPQPDPMGAAIGNAGQHLGRAAEAVKSGLERKENLMEKTAQALQLNRMGLENELLQAQIAKTRAQMGPGIPFWGQGSPGGGNTGDVVTDPKTGKYEFKPTEVSTFNPGDKSVMAGPPGPQNRWHVASPSGAVQGFPDPNVIQDQEITNPLMIRWILTQGWRKPPMNILPQGAMDWQWTPSGWAPVSGGGSGGSRLGWQLKKPTPLNPLRNAHGPSSRGYNSGSFLGR